MSVGWLVGTVSHCLLTLNVEVLVHETAPQRLGVMVFRLRGVFIISAFA